MDFPLGKLHLHGLQPALVGDIHLIVSNLDLWRVYLCSSFSREDLWVQSTCIPFPSNALAVDSCRRSPGFLHRTLRPMVKSYWSRFGPKIETTKNAGLRLT